jgi:ATP-dependent Clp protease protease subunit
MLYKRLEKYFFDTRAIYLWGVVDDKSAKDVVTNCSCWKPMLPAKKSSFTSAAPVVLLPAAW